MPYLAQLIYRSRATPLLRRGDMPAFVRAIAAANERQGITGALIFDGEYFLQVLEGRRRQLDALLTVLKHDPRHEAVVVLRMDAIKQRAFPDWGMSLVPLRWDDDSAPPADSIAADGLSPLQRIATQGDERLRLVIDAFARGHWRDEAPSLAQTALRPSRITPPHHPSVEAVTGDEVSFAFQPIVDTATGRVRAVEALVRGPQGESPAELLARHRGSDLYEFDLRTKAVAIAQFAALDLDCDLALNVLPMTLAHVPDAAAFLLQALQSHGLPPERLMLEVTEEEAITQPTVFIAQMQALRSAGVRVAIDDFGAGYAGLSLLSEFQPDKLKIDRTLVRDIHEHGPRQAIVRAVTDFCLALGIEVVAEGVEDAAEWHWLQQAGITRFQGFLFSRPQLNGVGEIRWY